MHVKELATIYEMDRNEPPASINHLLDYYQHLYISEKIDIAEYMKIFCYLSKQGARNAHANLESEK
ncbi:MAG TPA: YppF family protein [Virgibacillus sp.]|nr:YppF family protein [Virgibacillus sp.]